MNIFGPTRKDSIRSLATVITLLLIAHPRGTEATETVQWVTETEHFRFSYFDNFGTPWSEQYRTQVTWKKVEHTARVMENYIGYLEDAHGVRLPRKISFRFVFGGLLFKVPLEIDPGRMEVTVRGAETREAVAATDDLLDRPGLTPAASKSERGHGLRTSGVRGDDECDPVWSPDGSKLLFRSWRKDVPDLWVRDLRTGSVARLTDDAAVEMWPQWSPDGTKVSYVSDLKLYLMDVRSGDRRVVRGGGSGNILSCAIAGVASYRWSPDGKHIGVIDYANADYQSRAFIVTAEGRASPAAACGPPDTWKCGHSPSLPYWAPDSSVFATPGNNAHTLLLFDTAFRAREIAFWKRENCFFPNGLLWSPDSRTIAIAGFTMKDETKGEADTYQVITLDRDAGESKTIFESARPFDLLGWFEKADILFFCDNDLARLVINTGKVSRPGGYRTHEPRWRADDFTSVWWDRERGVRRAGAGPDLSLVCVESEPSGAGLPSYRFPACDGACLDLPKRRIWFLRERADRTPEEIDVLLTEMRASDFSFSAKKRKLAVVSAGTGWSLRKIVVRDL